LYYETIFIVNPDVSQENTEELTDALIQRVEKAGSRIVKREYWGSRPLAYQIAKRKRGHYVLLVTDGEIKAVNALEEGLRLDERVLRMMTTRLTELSDEPSPLLRRKVREESKPAEEPAATDAAATPETEAKAEAEAPAKEAEAAAPEAEAKAEAEAPAKEAVAEKSEGGEAAA